LVDEYNSSKTYPTCQALSLETSKIIDYPRPYQRHDHPKVKCHGLSRCTNQNYKKAHETFTGAKLWHCDLAAALNFKHIFDSLRLSGTIPG
ncbi:hypothetical protein BDF19DRAFT_385461, partial [Syncephalis fuscata]